MDPYFLMMGVIFMASGFCFGVYYAVRTIRLKNEGG